MDGKNPFHELKNDEPNDGEHGVVASVSSEEVNSREIESVPRSVWTLAGYLLLITLLGLAVYSLIQQRRQMDILYSELEDRRADVAQAEARALQSETRIITLNQEVSTLSTRTEQLSSNVMTLEATKTSLEDEKQKLIEARDEATKIQETLKNEMLAALESRDVTISELQGNLTLNILDRILFDSGQAIIKPEGQAVLQEIAGLLQQVPNRQIHVLGHTDNIPIRTSSYPSNWELSAARALAAVRFLVDDGGVAPQRIAAVAHGEFQPIASNDTPEGRARNRRITIVVLPEVFKTPEEIVDAPLPDELPDAKSSEAEAEPPSAASNSSEETGAASSSDTVREPEPASSESEPTI